MYMYYTLKRVCQVRTRLVAGGVMDMSPSASMTLCLQIGTVIS